MESFNLFVNHKTFLEAILRSPTGCGQETFQFAPPFLQLYATATDGLQYATVEATVA